MAKVGEFLHDSFVATPVAGIDSNYNIARVHQHDLYDGLAGKEGKTFQDRIESIVVRFTGLAAATSVTVRLCMDAAGDYTIVPDTTANLSFGVTTGTTACAAVYYGAPIKNVVGNNDTVYLFVKLNAGGTGTLDASCVTWSE
jgi:hypothetical protein